MYEPASEAYERLIARAVIKHAIKDLGGRDFGLLEIAIKYIASQRFSVHRENAGYPTELLDSLTGLGVLSMIQRRILARQILKELDKIPA